MNERFKKIREELGFSQEKFGEVIGLSKSGISNIESGQRNVTDKHIKLLSSELNVNEEWLRTGEGSMFNESDTFSLDDYAKQRKVSDLELDIIKIYFELDPDTRHGLLEHFKNGLSKNKGNTESKKIEEPKEDEPNIRTYPKSNKNDKKDYSPPRVTESEVKYKYNVDTDIDINAELASYKKQLEAEHQNKRSSVLPDSNLG